MVSVREPLYTALRYLSLACREFCLCARALSPSHTLTRAETRTENRAVLGNNRLSTELPRALTIIPSQASSSGASTNEPTNLLPIKHVYRNRTSNLVLLLHYYSPDHPFLPGIYSPPAASLLPSLHRVRSIPARSSAQSRQRGASQTAAKKQRTGPEKPSVLLAIASAAHPVLFCPLLRNPIRFPLPQNTQPPTIALDCRLNHPSNHPSRAYPPTFLSVALFLCFPSFPFARGPRPCAGTATEDQRKSSSGQGSQPRCGGTRAALPRTPSCQSFWSSCDCFSSR